MRTLFLAFLAVLFALTSNAQTFKYDYQTSFFNSYITGRLDSSSIMTLDTKGKFVFRANQIEMHCDNGSIYVFKTIYKQKTRNNNKCKMVKRDCGVTTEYYCFTGNNMYCKLTKYRTKGKLRTDYITLSQHYSDRLEKFTQIYIYLHN